MQMPVPEWVWKTRGFQTHNPPTASDLEGSFHRRMAGFKFHGEGWYPKQRCFVVAVDGGYNVFFYSTDPRPAFAQLSGRETTQ